MADLHRSTDGPTPFEKEGWDPNEIPDFDNDFVREEDIETFARALADGDISPSDDDQSTASRKVQFITALNDWKPVHQRVKEDEEDNELRRKSSRKVTRTKRSSKTPARKPKKQPRRNKDETRAGWTYTIARWPFLLLAAGWIAFLAFSYVWTRSYIWAYEHVWTWKGKRNRLRRTLRAATHYKDWVKAAEELDTYLDNDQWKEVDEYAYYNSDTIRTVTESLHNMRLRIERYERTGGEANTRKSVACTEELKTVLMSCVKNNFKGFENARLYSETYYGTKNLLQSFVDEVTLALQTLFDSPHLSTEEKRIASKALSTNLGRTALCLSGGATFAYYHFGIAKALLDADLMPPIVTGTSGGAVVAALICTRTDDELKKILVPALAHRIKACQDPTGVWIARWWKTGARFDSIDWARHCAWFTRGSMTFREAYERTGRTLNVSCVPSDPHTPTILANYQTAPDCVIWSAVLASAAVPGILNPVVLLRKRKDGRLEPFEFGTKWKDGSLRTDIPIRQLNTLFNVNFSIVSQVNPHVNLFFFSSRGTVGRPVTHRRGRGWRGGFIGSALEQYLKLDMTKWLKIVKRMELLPRWMGQDWSDVWLQQFGGSITVWPKTKKSDFVHILSDPTPERLAYMIFAGQQAAFPKITFIGNRLKIERVVQKAREETRPVPNALPTPMLDAQGLRNRFSDEALQELLRQAREEEKTADEGTSGVASSSDRPAANGHAANSKTKRAKSSGKSTVRRRSPRLAAVDEDEVVAGEKTEEKPVAVDPPKKKKKKHERSDSLTNRLSGWLGFGSPSTRPEGSNSVSPSRGTPAEGERASENPSPSRRRTSAMAELQRQSAVFFDDFDMAGEGTDETEPVGEVSGGGTAGESLEESAVESDERIGPDSDEAILGRSEGEEVDTKPVAVAEKAVKKQRRKKVKRVEEDEEE